MAATATHYAAIRLEDDGCATWVVTVPAGSSPADTFRSMMQSNHGGYDVDATWYMQPIRLDDAGRLILNPGDGRHSKPHVFRWRSPRRRRLMTNATETLVRANLGVLGYLLEPETVPEESVAHEYANYRAVVRRVTPKELTWPRCPLCYLNLAHELTCTDRRCHLPKVAGYDWMLDRAVKDAVEKADELGVREERAA
jgi:hypothetical protein